MRTSRSILYTAVGTVLCLFYVFQQTEIVKLGYKINSAESMLEACLDRKIALQYTLSSLESPLNIDKELLLKKEGFEIAKSYRLVKLEPGQAGSGAVAAGTKEKSVFKRLAMVRWFQARSAQAQTVE